MPPLESNCPPPAAGLVEWTSMNRMDAWHSDMGLPKAKCQHGDSFGITLCVPILLLSEC